MGHLRALAVGVAIALAVGGCGDDARTAEDRDPPTTTVSTTTTGAPTTTSPPLTTTTPAPPPMSLDGTRYLDPVFGQIETIENVVYWPDAPPQPDLGGIGISDLTMDIHLPAGDTETNRPVIMAFEMSAESWVVEDYVQRGYVVVVPEVHGRPNTPSAAALRHTRQGMVDAAAAVRWLRANADVYGIDGDAIAATGYSGAGIVSLALAWGQENSPDITELDLFGVVTVPVPGAPDFGEHHVDQPSRIAAVFPMAAWYPPELIDPGEPPAMLFSGTDDPTYPFAAVEQICPTAVAAGVHCDFRTFATGHDLGHQSTISVESAAFLYEQMLAPLGVVDAASLPVATPDERDLIVARPIHTISPDSLLPPVPAPVLEDLAAGPDGIVYVASSEGIVVVDAAGSVSSIDLDGVPEGSPGPEDSYLTSRFVAQIAVSPTGTLWAAGWAVSSVDDVAFGGVVDGWSGARILRWVAARECARGVCTWQAFTSDDVAALDLEGDLAATADGHAYLSLSEARLLAYDGARWATHAIPGVSAFAPWSRELTVHGDRVIWASPFAGRDGAALMSYAGSVFGLSSPSSDLPRQARSIAVSDDGTVWAALAPSTDGPLDTPGAIMSFDGTGWRPHTIGDGSFTPNTVAAGPEGTAWTVGDGAYAWFDGTDWTVTPTDFATSRLIVGADDGTLWMATGTVLVSFDGTTEQIHGSPFRGSP